MGTRIWKMVVQKLVSDELPASIRRNVVHFPGYPQQSLPQIYPLRARRRPRRVKGSSVSRPVCVFLQRPYVSCWFVCVCGTRGWLGRALVFQLFFHIVFWRFFEGFGIDFGWLLGWFSHVFCIAFSTPIFKQLFLIFHICSFRANPRRHAFYCSPLVYKRLRHFRKR